jgi:hypothetical protein
VVTIMLETNDLKMRFNALACDIATGACVLVDTVAKREAGAVRVRQIL